MNVRITTADYTYSYAYDVEAFDPSLGDFVRDAVNAGFTVELKERAEASAHKIAIPELRRRLRLDKQPRGTNR